MSIIVLDDSIGKEETVSLITENKPLNHLLKSNFNFLWEKVKSLKKYI